MEREEEEKKSKGPLHDLAALVLLLGLAVEHFALGAETLTLGDEIF